MNGLGRVQLRGNWTTKTRLEALENDADDFEVSVRAMSTSLNRLMWAVLSCTLAIIGTLIGTR